MSEIGANHRALIMPNQDSVAFDSLGENFVLAVSDGVGSCKNAADGSRAAVSIAVELFQQIISGQRLVNQTEICELLISMWKDKVGEKTDDYCATLKLAYKIENQIFLFSIGDGLLVATSGGQRILAPNKNQDFSNITKCLCQNIVAKDFWKACLNIDCNTSYAVMLSTDGISNGICEGTELELCEEIENNVNIDELEMEIKNFFIEIEENSYDDKTLGVVKYEYKHA